MATDTNDSGADTALTELIAEDAAPALAANTWSTSGVQQWWLVGSVTLLMMLSAVDRQIIALLIQPIKTDLKLTDTEVSLLMGLSYAVVHTLIIIPSGWAADRWVRKVIIALGAVSWSIMTMLCGLANTFWQLFAARAGVGLTEGTIEPSAYSIVRDGVSPTRRGRAFGIMGMAPLVGQGVAMMVGGILLTVFAMHPLVIPGIGPLAPWQSVLVAVGAVGIPMAFIMFTNKEPNRQTAASAKAPDPTWKETLAHIRPNWVLYASVLVFGIAHSMIAASFGAWLPTFLIRVYGMSPMQVGMTFGIAIMIAAPLGGFVAGLAIDLAKKLGNRGGLPLVGLVGTVLIGIPAVLAPQAPTQLVFWCLLGVQLLVAAVPFPVVATAIARATPSPLMGKIISLRIFLGGIAVSTVAPTLVAAISDTVFGGDAGGPRAIGHAISVVSAASAVVALAACAVLWRDYAKRVDVDD